MNPGLFFVFGCMTPLEPYKLLAGGTVGVIATFYVTVNCKCAFGGVFFGESVAR